MINEKNYFSKKNNMFYTGSSQIKRVFTMRN